MGSNRFRTDLPRLMEFHRRGKLHLDFVSAHIKLDQINEGFVKGGPCLAQWPSISRLPSRNLFA